MPGFGFSFLEAPVEASAFGSGVSAFDVDACGSSDGDLSLFLLPFLALVFPAFDSLALGHSSVSALRFFRSDFDLDLRILSKPFSLS